MSSLYRPHSWPSLGDSPGQTAAQALAPSAQGHSFHEPGSLRRGAGASHAGPGSRPGARAPAAAAHTPCCRSWQPGVDWRCRSCPAPQQQKHGLAGEVREDRLAFTPRLRPCHSTLLQISYWYSMYNTTILFNIAGTLSKPPFFSATEC